MTSRSNTDLIAKDLDAIVPQPPSTGSSAAVEQRIAGLLSQSLEPVRPMPSRTAIVGAFLLVFAVVTALLFGFVGTRGAQVMTLSQLAGVLTAILTSAGLAAYFLSGEMTPGQRRFVRPGVMIAAVLLVLLGLIYGLFPSETGAVHGWHCFRSGFLSSIPAVLMVFWVIRKGSPMAYGAVGATVGLIAGLAGMAAIHVGCSLLSAPHIAAGHLTIPLAGALVGYLAGRAWPYLLPHRRES